MPDLNTLFNGLKAAGEAVTNAVNTIRNGTTGQNLTNFFVEPEEAVNVGAGVGVRGMTPRTNATLQLGMGYNMPTLDVATPCMYIPATIVVTSVPQMYVHNGAPNAMGLMIKNLMESHAKQVSGIDFTYANSPDTSAQVGHDSQTLGTPTKTTRSAVQPSFQFTEIGNNTVRNCFQRWMWDIQHPDTNASMAQVEFPGAWTMSAYAASFLVIQFDPTMRPERILDAAHYVNVWPSDIGPIGFERGIGQVRPQERTIQFTAVVQHNPMIKYVAMKVAERLRLHVHNYDAAPANPALLDPTGEIGVGHAGGAVYGIDREQSERAGRMGGSWVDIAKNNNDVPRTPNAPDSASGTYQRPSDPVPGHSMPR